MSDLIKAIIYTRFSPRPNADESLSAEKQQQACRAYCERHGYEVVKVYGDCGVSGDNPDRGGLWEAINALRRGWVLVVRWRNRLARDVYLSETIRRAVAKQGARIEAAEEGNNGDDPDSVFIQHILAAFAEREKKVIALRTKHAMLRYQREGRVMSKSLPYGYCPDPANPGKMIEDLAEQETLRIMLKLASGGGVGYRAIARELDMMGCPPRTAAEWDHGVVAKILKRAGA